MVKEHPAGMPYVVEVKNDNTRRTDTYTWFATEVEANAACKAFNESNQAKHLWAVVFLCKAMPDHPAFATPNRNAR